MSDRLAPLNHSVKLAAARALLRSPEFITESAALRACDVLKRHGDWMDREQARHVELVIGVPPRPFKAPQEAVNARQAAEEATATGMMRRGAAVAAGLLLLSALIIFDPMPKIAERMLALDMNRVSHEEGR